MKSQPIPQHAYIIPPNTPTGGGTALVPDPSRRATPDDMIFAGIKAGVPIETLERLYALKQKYEADEARKAYVAAMAEFKRNPPEIFKRSQVSFSTAKGKTEYMHADLGEVCEQIVGALAMHGFSHAWNPTTNGKMIEVTCALTHSLGHSESVTLSGASDDSGGKNAIQADASTRTYLQRYSLLAITGLATKAMGDDDGRGPRDEVEYLDEHEQVIVGEWIETAKVNKARFLEWLRVETVAELPKSDYHKALNKLKEIAKQKGIE